ncbi:tetratricopeptide repeat protein [Rhodospira trueperi]|uniref:Flp pilus assembly protein TadD, contains TPR repeats n=1 Tax=Rhodospira trueperi TaxID=69960 RepID=A0A1G7E5X3_9PROT|nr:tetratricopeptide repeat protein [Rhodospira trueperi]SDE59072.1 Flp pilus assembly protein TadD, contains TPR repeats [Rhodospira trueperi]
MSEVWRARSRLAVMLLVGGVLLSGCGGLSGSTSGGASAAPEAALVETLAEMARGNEAKNRYSKAAEQYARLVETDPENETFVLGLARNLRYMGRPQDAFRALNRAMMEDSIPDSMDVRLEMVRILMASGAHEDAQSRLTELSASAPNDPRVLPLLGILADRDGRHREAQEAYRAALAVRPSDLRTANNLALSLALSGDLEEAIQLQNRIARDPSATMQIRQNLALLYAFAGRMDVAEQITRALLPKEAADQVVADLGRMVGRAEAMPRPNVEGAVPLSR